MGDHTRICGLWAGTPITPAMSRQGMGGCLVEGLWGVDGAGVPIDTAMRDARTAT